MHLLNGRVATLSLALRKCPLPLYRVGAQGLPCKCVRADNIEQIVGHLVSRADIVPGLFQSQSQLRVVASSDIPDKAKKWARLASGNPQAGLLIQVLSSQTQLLFGLSTTYFLDLCGKVACVSGTGGPEDQLHRLTQEDIANQNSA